MRASAATRRQTLSGASVSDRSTWLDRWALERIRRTVAAAPLRFMLWDGFELPARPRPVATIVFKNRRALFSWVWDPDLNFGEAYMFGAVEIRGDLQGLLEAIYQALGTKPRPWWLWQRSNDTRTARENVHQHYDLGNDFYRLWLDRRDGLHLRLLSDAGLLAGRCADRQDGSRLPQAGPQARRSRGRSRLRMGLAGAVHGEAVRRHREGVQHLVGADRLRAGSRERRRARRSGRVHRGRLSQRARSLRRVRLGRHARARRPG